MKNLFWSMAFVFSLVFLAAAYYITSQNVRTSVDARAPWVHHYLGPFVRESSDSKTTASKQSSAEAPDTAPRFVETNATPVPTTPVPVPAAPPEPEVFDLNKLAKNPAAWPAKIMINKATDFPAVVNGRKAGMIHVPSGTEVKLAKISDGKLGVEYQGGGAWLLLEETDLVARTMNKRN
jgi:hypothetical protein